MFKSLQEFIVQTVHNVWPPYDKLRGNDLHQQLMAAKSKLALTQRQHRWLQLYRGSKSTATSTPSDELIELRDVLKAKTATIGHLENVNRMLEEAIESLQASGTPSLEKGVEHSHLRYRCSSMMPLWIMYRPKVFWLLYRNSHTEIGMRIDTVPHRSTVEMMTRELGVICDLQVAEVLMRNSNQIPCFDAMTHIWRLIVWTSPAKITVI